MSLDLRASKNIHDALIAVLNCVEMEEERHFVSTADLFNDLFQVYSAKLDPKKEDITIENSYVGLHLGDYEVADFERLVKSFENHENLHAVYTLKIIDDAKKLLNLLPNIQTCEVKNDNDTVIIVGDLHGNFRDLKYIIDKYGIPGSNYQFIFNGDFVDRGNQQIEVLLTILYSFILYPDRVFLNRGNHEDISMNTHSKFNPNFFGDIHSKYDDFSHVVFEAAEDLFIYLPLATIVVNEYNVRFFVVHGGISNIIDIDFIENEIDRKSFKRIAFQPKNDAKTINSSEQIKSLLWSDPLKHLKKADPKLKGINSLTGCFFNKKRNIGHLFGYDITKKFCEKYNFDFILRSHEVREDGFELDHDKCFTVFSASFYQNHTNYAAVCIFRWNSELLMSHKFKTKDEYRFSELHESNIELIRKFKRVLLSPDYNLHEIFKSLDKDNTGYLDFDEWAKIICDLFETISKENLFHLKDYICVCDDTTNSVKYETMFTNIKALMSEEYIIHLENLFRIIDLNHDNKISLYEVEQALSLISDKLLVPAHISEKYLEILKNMDKNDDHYIDFEEFKSAFLKEFSEKTHI